MRKEAGVAVLIARLLEQDACRGQSPAHDKVTYRSSHRADSGRAKVVHDCVLDPQKKPDPVRELSCGNVVFREPEEPSSRDQASSRPTVRQPLSRLAAARDSSRIFPDANVRHE